MNTVIIILAVIMAISLILWFMVKLLNVFDDILQAVISLQQYVEALGQKNDALLHKVKALEEYIDAKMGDL